MKLAGYNSRAFESVAPKLGHQPTFDGLRGWAMIAVLFAHGSYVMFASLAASVDVFFVVSGFLITTLLLEENRKTRTISLRNFYKRRALRLLPMLYLVIAATVLGIFVTMQMHGAEATAGVPGNTTYGELWSMTKSDAITASFYLYHVVHPVGLELIEGGWPEIRPLIQLWSLSVEEHFYVFGVLITLWAVRRRWVTQLMVAFVAFYLFVAIARATGHVGPQLAWYQRPDSIMLGVVLAFVNARMGSSTSPRFRRNLALAATVSAVLFAATVFVGTGFARPLGLFVPFSPDAGGSLNDGLYWGKFGFTICSAAIAVIVIAMVRLDQHWIKPLLSWKPIQGVGVRSYSIYLIHVPLWLILINLVPSNQGMAVLVYLPALVVTTLLAHRYVERPMMKLKNRSSAPVATTGDATPTTPANDRVRMISPTDPGSEQPSPLVPEVIDLREIPAQTTEPPPERAG